MPRNQICLAACKTARLRQFLTIDYTAHQKIEKPSFGVAIYGGDGLFYTGTNTAISEYPIDFIEGPGTIFYRVDYLPLLSGVYRVRADLHDKHLGVCDKLDEAAYLHVKGGKFSGGVFYTQHAWSFNGMSGHF